MKVRFLLDENLSPRLKVAVLRLNPAIALLYRAQKLAAKLRELDIDPDAL